MTAIEIMQPVSTTKTMQEPTGNTNDSRESRKTLSVLWTQHHHMVLGYIRSVAIDFHLADDILQETAATVAEKFDEYDPSRPFLPWVIGIARNKVLLALRTHSRDRCVFDDELITQLSVTYSELDNNGSDAQIALSECIALLQHRAQKLLELRYVRDMSGTAIAHATGMTASAAGVALHRIRKALKSCIANKLGDPLRQGGAS